MDNLKVVLPKPENTNGAKNIKSFLRQMELCIHHLQKGIEEMEKDGEVGDNTFIIYRFPILEDRETDKESYIKVHSDELADQMQIIELEIVTV